MITLTAHAVVSGQSRHLQMVHQRLLQLLLRHLLLRHLLLRHLLLTLLLVVTLGLRCLSDLDLRDLLFLLQNIKHV